MKQIYLNVIFVVLAIVCLTSCKGPKYSFVTKGLSETDSSYVIKKNGQRVNASNIVVRPRELTVDGQKMSTGDLSVIKSKKMYFIVDGDNLYLTEVYGKLKLLYTLSYTYNYSANNYASGNRGASGMSSTTVNKSYYLQKEGIPGVVKLTRSSFLEYVSDNDDALAKAKAHYIWNYTSLASFSGFVVGTVYLVSAVTKDNGSGNYAAPISILLGSYLLHGVLTSVADHKLHKAIAIYNATE